MATLLILLTSCGGQEPAGEAQALLRQAQAAMSELSSYHATITTSGEDIAGSGHAIKQDWARPDSFRYVTPIIRVTGSGTCGPVAAGDPLPLGCTEVQGETLKGYGEAVLISDRLYGRECQEEGSQCGEWDVRDAGPLAIMGVSFTQADWTVTALTMIREAKVVGQENMDALSTIHVRGRLNAAQAKVDTWRRAAQDADIDTVGEECRSEEVQTPLTEGEPPPTVIATPECRPVTVDEFLALGQEAVERQQRNPSSVDVWIGSDDHMLRRFSASFPPDESGEGEKDVIVEFSRFNEVVIEPPN
jgi:hypothetical protein